MRYGNGRVLSSLTLNYQIVTMNKIYSDPLFKAESLSEGIAKHPEELLKKGIRPDTEQLKQICEALRQAAIEQEAAERTLSEKRAKAHDLLERLKNLYNDTKAPIKANFAPEEWSRFGCPDKR